MKETVLITGGSGLLAVNWARCIKKKYNVVLGVHKRMTKVEGCKSIYLPLKSVKKLIDIIENINCTLVIHTAALTSIDKCENEPHLAEYINVKLAGNVARACQIMSITLVHISLIIYLMEIKNL